MRPDRPPFDEEAWERETLMELCEEAERALRPEEKGE